MYTKSIGFNYIFNILFDIRMIIVVFFPVEDQTALFYGINGNKMINFLSELWRFVI